MSNGTLQVTLRQRTFHFNWCNKTEVDYVCMKCGTIAVDGICGHCQQERERKAASLERFLESKKQERRI